MFFVNAQVNRLPHELPQKQQQQQQQKRHVPHYIAGMGDGQQQHDPKQEQPHHVRYRHVGARGRGSGEDPDFLPPVRAKQQQHHDTLRMDPHQFLYAEEGLVARGGHDNMNSNNNHSDEKHIKKKKTDEWNDDDDQFYQNSIGSIDTAVVDDHSSYYHPQQQQQQHHRQRKREGLLSGNNTTAVVESRPYYHHHTSGNLYRAPDVSSIMRQGRSIESNNSPQLVKATFQSSIDNNNNNNNNNNNETVIDGASLLNMGLEGFSDTPHTSIPRKESNASTDSLPRPYHKRQPSASSSATSSPNAHKRSTDIINTPSRNVLPNQSLISAPSFESYHHPPPKDRTAAAANSQLRQASSHDIMEHSPSHHISFATSSSVYEDEANEGRQAKASAYYSPIPQKQQNVMQLQEPLDETLLLGSSISPTGLKRRHAGQLQQKSFHESWPSVGRVDMSLNGSWPTSQRMSPGGEEIETPRRGHVTTVSTLHASDIPFPDLDASFVSPPRIGKSGNLPFIPSLDDDGEVNQHLPPAPRSMCLDELYLVQMESGESSSLSAACNYHPRWKTTTVGNDANQLFWKNEPRHGSLDLGLVSPHLNSQTMPQSDLSSVPLSLLDDRQNDNGKGHLSAFVQPSSPPATADDPRNNIKHKRTDLTHSTDSSSSLMSSIEFSELTLDSVIGGGGFGQVWRALWKGTPVAVKVLTGSAQAENVSKSVLEEFVAEINMLSGMRHPNICLYIGACMKPPNRAIVTELASHGSLWDALRQPLSPPYKAADGRTRTAWPLSAYNIDITTTTTTTTKNMNLPMVPSGTWYEYILQSNRWPWQLVKRAASGAARGMAYLHGGNPPVLHRDLKSANLLLDDSYTTKVADFGLSRLKAQERSMTENCGTVQWMAPEVLANHHYAEPADVYSFGIILWELLSRECPYDGMSPIQCALAVLNSDARPEIPIWCPSSLADLIRACWDKDSSSRPTFAQIISALDAMPS
eukprot:scaffold97816_cov59-Attheya_sp.AAC.1